jgi:hypothetical protein
MSGKTDFVPSFRFQSGELFLLPNRVGKGHFLLRLGAGTLLDFGEDFFEVGYRAVNWGDGFGGELLIFCLHLLFCLVPILPCSYIPFLQTNDLTIPLL